MVTAGVDDSSYRQRLMAQIYWIALKVSSQLMLFNSHQINWV